MLKNIIFWVLLAAFLIYGHQNNWFFLGKGAGKIYNAVKSDIEHQRSLMPEEEKFKDPTGTLTVEEGGKKVVRRSALGVTVPNR